MSLLASVQVYPRANVFFIRRARSVVLAQTATRYHKSAITKASVAVAAETPPSLVVPRSQPFAAPQDKASLVEKAYDARYYSAVAKIMEIRQKYIEERCIFVEGETMIPLLQALGAKDEDFESIRHVSDHLGVDPTLPFRESKNGRFLFKMDDNRVCRLEPQLFALSTEEGFKRYDSGQTRRFDEVGNDLQLNTVFQALLVFKAMVFHGVETARRPSLDYARNNWICTLFNLRTITTPSLLGEPALEGVHSDGVDHTMTTYLDSRNMAPNSAVTFIHDMAETTGVPLDHTTTKLVRARSQHRHFLDTIVIVDHERKHSISPVYAIDKTKSATRDMLIFFTRKPAVKGHISEGIDSLNAHQVLPMEVPLWVPRQQFLR